VVQEQGARTSIARAVVVCCVTLSGIGATPALAQSTTAAGPPVDAAPVQTTEQDNGWNVWENKAFMATLLLTFGADVGGYVQDDNNTTQVGDQPTLVKWRAERINAAGRLNFATPWTWQLGGNYNGLEADRGDHWSWMDVRIDVPVPKVGRIKIGRQKVGVNQEWELPLVDSAFMERVPSSGAFVPQRNDGVIVTNTFAAQRGLWSAGWFNDWYAKDNSFSDNGNQYSARLSFMPVDTGAKGDTFVQIATSLYYKEATNGTLQYRARPEINQSDYFVDTGKFEGDHSVTSELETMTIKGPLQVFGEWMMTPVSSPRSGNPFFFGGYAGVAYVLTGEHRNFNRLGGYQTRLVPAAPFGFSDPAPGAWEVAGRYSYLDLTDGAVDGGVMSRWSGALSWYATREWRFEFNYGYITLDKAGLRGHAHGISSRIVWNM
jgi:phosphate-selective porin OprO/OprP